jgi:hypothetical protein
VCRSLSTEFKRREEAPEMGLRTESKQNPNTDHTQSSHQHLTVHSNTSNRSNKGWVYLDDHKRHPLCKVLEVIDRSILADTYLYFGCYLEKFGQDFTVATLCHHFSLVNWTKDCSQNEVLLCYYNFICVICHLTISVRTVSFWKSHAKSMYISNTRV